MTAAAAASSATGIPLDEAALENQLRNECYELHAIRSEVSYLTNKQRDVECRYEYLRTLFANLQRSEEQLKKTLAYETATTEAVLHATRSGQQLPPALAADATTSIICPPVHLAGESDARKLYQSRDDVVQQQLHEKRQLQKEVDDMKAVIKAERRSIGALQHAMYAQAAWGDAVVESRNKRHRVQQELMAEISTAQTATRAQHHQEEVLRQRIQQQHQEMELKTRRLQQLQDASRVQSLQLEELRSAVVTSRRDLVRAQTLDQECEHVARMAQTKAETIMAGGGVGVDAAGGGGVLEGASGVFGGAEILARAAGPMFVSAFGGRGGGGGGAATVAQQQQQHQRGQEPWQLASGTQRYDKNLYAASTGLAAASSGAFPGVGSGVNTATSLPQAPLGLNVSNVSYAPFGWTAAGAGVPPSAAIQHLQQQQQQEQQQAQQQQQQHDARRSFDDAKAESNEWMRRYVGSLRGLHLTALQVAPQQ